jgi:hypothetical protein
MQNLRASAVGPNSAPTHTSAPHTPLPETTFSIWIITIASMSIPPTLKGQLESIPLRHQIHTGSAL